MGAEGKATIHYHDIGDYLNREEKLAIVKKFKTVADPEMHWQQLEPNEHGDWISQRNNVFETFVPIGDKETKTKTSIFNPFYSRGLATARDSYCYNSSKVNMVNVIHDFINYYEQQRIVYHSKDHLKKIEDFLDFETKKVTWNRGLKNDFARNYKIEFQDKSVVKGLYRPFFKQHLYCARELNDMIYQIPKLFPSPASKNLVICVSSNYKDGSILISDLIPDLHFNGDTQAFPLYYYEERQKTSPTLFDVAGENEFIRRDGVSDFILERAKKQYGLSAAEALEATEGTGLSKEDIFYYVYGFLHSPEYREKFANDLKKMLPRIPLVEDVRDFWKFSKAGRQLADLHINYEKVPAFPGVKVVYSRGDSKSPREYQLMPDLESPAEYLVSKMRFPKKDQKDTIIYNSRITIENIPAKAYE